MDVGFLAAQCIVKQDWSRLLEELQQLQKNKNKFEREANMLKEQNRVLRERVQEEN